MVRLARVKAAPWLVAMVVLFLLLGHVCELPAFVDLVAHSTASAHHHEMDHPPDGSQIPCEVVDATNVAHPQMGVALDCLRIGSIGGSVPIGLIGLAAQESITPPPRPPLFLLHRSLLI